MFSLPLDCRKAPKWRLALKHEMHLCFSSSTQRCSYTEFWGSKSKWLQKHLQSVHCRNSIRVSTHAMHTQLILDVPVSLHHTLSLKQVISQNCFRLRAFQTCHTFKGQRQPTIQYDDKRGRFVIEKKKIIFHITCFLSAYWAVKNQIPF